MKFLSFLLTRFREHVQMLKLFIINCLLFQSEEKVYWILGSLAWASFFLLMYGLYNLFLTE